MLIERNMPPGSGLSKRKEAFLRGLPQILRGRRGSFLAEGMRVVEEALAGRWRVTDIVGTPSTAADIEGWRADGKLAGVVIAITDERTFGTLAESVHPQGVLAVVEEPRLALRELRGAGPVLILDGLQDPGNAGTLVRSLHATGGTTVLALKGTVDLFNPKAVRATAGSLFHLEIAARVDVEEALAWMEARNLPLLALDRTGEPLSGGDSLSRPFRPGRGERGGGSLPPVDRSCRPAPGYPHAPRRAFAQRRRRGERGPLRATAWTPRHRPPDPPILNCGQSGSWRPLARYSPCAGGRSPQWSPLFLRPPDGLVVTDISLREHEGIVLVIDDEDGVRQSLQQILEYDGFSVVLAANADQGLSRFREEPPDVVLLDIKMPRMDGHGGVGRLRELDPDAVVIMISGHGTIARRGRRDEEGRVRLPGEAARQRPPAGHAAQRGGEPAAACGEHRAAAERRSRSATRSSGTPRSAGVLERVARWRRPTRAC